MNINLTLVIQMVVFATVVWFTMSFIWPKIMGAIEERSRKIAEDLAAARKGREDYAQAEERAAAVVREARERAHQIVDQAQHQANEIIGEARTTASTEGTRLIAAAKEQIALEQNRAREQLRREVGSLAVSTAAKLLQREIDPRKHAELLDELATEL